MEQKIAHARVFRDRFAIKRPIVVDDLNGTLHRQFGMLPNMTYLVGRAGRVLFRSDWTDAATAETAICYMLEAKQRRREGLRLKPFFTEMVGYRWSDQAAFDAGLEVAGPQAVADFAAATERWNAGGAVPGRVATGETEST
jgi:hypothetical protein